MREGSGTAKGRAWSLRPGRAACLILLALGAVALAACGGDDSGGNTPAPTSQQPGTSTKAAASPAAATGGATATNAPAATAAPGGGNTTSANACALLTKADAEAALGESLPDPESVSVGSQQLGPGLTVSVSNCSYASATTTHSVEIDLWLADSSSASVLQQTIEFACQTKENISGLGDVACWYDSDHGELQVAKASAFLDLRATTGGDATETLKALAQKALSRLP